MNTMQLRVYNVVCNCKLSKEQSQLLNSNLLIMLNKIHLYVWENAKVRSDVMSLRKEDGSCTCSDQETAQCLNDFFTSVFTTEPDRDLPSLPDKSKGHCLNDITISHSDILHELDWLKPINLAALITATYVFWKK